MFIAIFAPTVRVACKNPFKHNIGIDNKGCLANIYGAYGEKKQCIDFTKRKSSITPKRYSTRNWTNLLTRREKMNFTAMTTIMEKRVWYELVYTRQSPTTAT